MPRNIPTTSWNERTGKTTTWVQPRAEDCLTWDEATFPWNDATFSWDSTCDGLITAWKEPRYDFYLEDLTGINVVDLSGEEVVGLSGEQTNKIDTTWN